MIVPKKTDSKLDSQSDSVTLKEAKKVRISNIKNAMICHLNINHIRNKLNELKILTADFMPTVLAISETKVDSSFPNAYFTNNGYF